MGLLFGLLKGLSTTKGTTINDLGVGPEEIEKKIISEALLREKKSILRATLREKINFERHSPGKNKF